VGAYMLRPAVARWYIFKPKIPILEVLGIETVGTLYAHLKYTTAIWFIFMAIWCIFTHCGILYQKNLATLAQTAFSK
jgi:hypothetical protein